MESDRTYSASRTRALKALRDCTNALGFDAGTAVIAEYEALMDRLVARAPFQSKVRLDVERLHGK